MKKHKPLLLLMGVMLVCACIPVGAQSSKEVGKPRTIELIDLGADRNEDGPVAQIFYETMMPGFQQSNLPRFIIAGKQRKFLLGIGGYVNARLGYDVGGRVDNLDFPTYNIPVNPMAGTNGQLIMDASTSRLFFKAIGMDKKGRQYSAYIETDFRGPGYTLRLRQAFVSYAGWTLGQTVTTFCDLMAGPTTVDFQGPNAYAYGRNVVIRYEHKFDEHWQAALALEKPTISMTQNTQTTSVPQTVPDIPLYVQYNWDKGASHVRISGVYRNLRWRDLESGHNYSGVGWGAQLSGYLTVCKKLNLFFQGVYGQGITQYIQDLQGNNLDLLPQAADPGKVETYPMMGWFAGAQYNFTKKLFWSGTYSHVRIYPQENNIFAGDTYRSADYMATNVFWTPLPSCQVGIEYLYGQRVNMDMSSGNANRIQVALQYNF